jgi:hypothetical protein
MAIQIAERIGGFPVVGGSLHFGLDGRRNPRPVSQTTYHKPQGEGNEIPGNRENARKVRGEDWPSLFWERIVRPARANPTGGVGKSVITFLR